MKYENIESEIHNTSLTAKNLFDIESQLFYEKNLFYAVNEYKSKKSILKNVFERIHRYLGYRANTRDPIPVHPEDVFTTILLRHFQAIPNLPVKMLGEGIVIPPQLQ